MIGLVALITTTGISAALCLKYGPRAYRKYVSEGFLTSGRTWNPAWWGAPRLSMLFVSIAPLMGVFAWSFFPADPGLKSSFFVPGSILCVLAGALAGQGIILSNQMVSGLKECEEALHIFVGGNALWSSGNMSPSEAVILAMRQLDLTAHRARRNRAVAMADGRYTAREALHWSARHGTALYSPSWLAMCDAVELIQDYLEAEK